MSALRTVIAAAALLLSVAATAKEFPPAWVSCTDTAECDVISSSCGPSYGIHKKHKMDAQAELCKSEDCSSWGCDGSARQASAAMCQAGQCMPDYEAKPVAPPKMKFELKNLELKCPPEKPDCGAIKTKP